MQHTEPMLSLFSLGLCVFQEATATHRVDMCFAIILRPLWDRIHCHGLIRNYCQPQTVLQD